MEEFRKEMNEDLWRTRKNKKVHRSRSPAGFTPQRRSLVFGAIGILILIVVFVLFFGGDDKVSTEDFYAIKTRLDEVEKRLTQLEGTEKKIARLEGQLNRLQQYIPKSDRSVDKRRYHVVRHGDSLSRIAQRYAITVGELCRLNQITPKTVIHPGQKLLVALGSQQ